DELPFSEDAHGPALERAVRRVAEAERPERVLRVAARALRVEQVDHLSFGLRPEDGDHRRRALRDRHRRNGLEVRSPDRLARELRGVLRVLSAVTFGLNGRRRRRRRLRLDDARAAVSSGLFALPQRDDTVRVDTVSDELIAQAIGALER